MLCTLLIATSLTAAPPMPASDADVPPWKQPGSPLPALVNGRIQHLVAGHEERWAQYRRLEMIPVDEAPAFLDRMACALEERTEHPPELPRDESGQVIQPVAAVPARSAAAPEGPMTPELNRKLAEALVDQLLFMQDRPFAFQRDRWLAGRRFALQFPDTDFNAAEYLEAAAKGTLNEEIDAAKLKEAEQWQLIERFYEQRRQTLDGGYCVTGAALDSEMGLKAGAYETTELLDSSRLPNRMSEDESAYWQGGLIACGLRVTWPPTPPSEILKRDGKILRAEVLLVVETKIGDLAPLSLHAYYDPAAGEGGRWEIESCCFTSSPFAAAVPWVR